MPRKSSGRRFQLTLNNPIEHGFDHERIKELLNQFASIIYYALCDEIGNEEKTLHTHIFLIAKNPIMFDSLKKRFPTAHIEACKGSNEDNRNYLLKQGKWADDLKNETSIEGSFEEFGEMPADRASSQNENKEIYKLIKEGISSVEIMEQFPNAMNKLDKIEKTRQTLLFEEYKSKFRELFVTYLWGKTGVGKTRGIMEQYGYENVYRVTDYKHPFDGYSAEDVIIFDEFRDSIEITNMLNYLDGYPLELPARYSNKTACFTKVFIISNIPLRLQYSYWQSAQPATWEAFLRRINDIYELKADGTKVYEDLPFF